MGLEQLALPRMGAHLYGSGTALASLMMIESPHTWGTAEMNLRRLEVDASNSSVALREALGSAYPQVVRLRELHVSNPSAAAEEEAALRPYVRSDDYTRQFVDMRKRMALENGAVRMQSFSYRDADENGSAKARPGHGESPQAAEVRALHGRIHGYTSFTVPKPPTYPDARQAAMRRAEEARGVILNTSTNALRDAIRDLRAGAEIASSAFKVS